jgi:hypothetical protein
MIHDDATPSVRRLVVTTALVLAQLAFSAAPATHGYAGERTPPIVDVASDARSQLWGQLVDRQGVAATATPIVLFKNGRAIARAQTNDEGKFVFGNVRGGVYVVAAPGAGQICRVWAPGTAPPTATPQTLLVAETHITRGQTFCPTSLYEWFEMHPVLGYTLATAAIALPIILITQEDDSADQQNLDQITAS